MLNAIFSMCIVALFSGWVWTLKHQLAQLPPGMEPAGAGHDSGRAGHPEGLHHEHDHHHKHAQHAHAQEPWIPPVKRAADGIPVWKIDADF